MKTPFNRSILIAEVVTALDELETHQIDVPPLRKRLEDIPLLLDHFIDLACQKMKKKNCRYSQPPAIK